MTDGRLSDALGVLTRSWHIPLVGHLSRYARRLSPGDKFIAGLLGLIVVVSSLLALYALERSLLVVQPAYGGSLTEGVVGAPRFVNPLLALTDTDRDLSTLTYAGLMGLGGGNGSLRPVLAESYAESSDGKTYTFTLRSNATFSDGTPVTADDVVYTVQKAQDPALKSPVLADWTNIKVEAIDSRTVRFTLSKAYEPFLEDATLGILPSHLWKNISDQDFPFATLQTEPVGAGPFRVASVNRDRAGDIVSYDLSAFKGYVLGRPYLDAFHFKFFTDITALSQALAKGTVESAYGINRPGVLAAPYARVFGVFFNPAQNTAFANIEVRKALSVAIDRDHIVKTLLGGYAAATYGPVPAGSGISMASSTGMLVTASSTADRIGEAKDILSRNGWTYDEGLGTWKKGAQSISITLKTSNVPELKVIASSVQNDWKALGIPVSLELSDPNQLTQQVIAPRNYGALLFGEVIGHNEDLYAFWDSSERTSPGLNIADYSNKVVDTLLERIRTTDTPSDKLADLQKANDLIASEFPAAFTHTPDFLYAVPNDLHGVELMQIASPSDRFATVSSWYRVSEAVWPFLVRSKQ